MTTVNESIESNLDRNIQQALRAYLRCELIYLCNSMQVILNKKDLSYGLTIEHSLPLLSVKKGGVIIETGHGELKCNCFSADTQHFGGEGHALSIEFFFNNLELQFDREDESFCGSSSDISTHFLLSANWKAAIA